MTKRERRLVVAVATTLLVAAAGAQPMIGTAAPGFDLATVGGGSLSLGDLEGRYVVLHFGASW